MTVPLQAPRILALVLLSAAALVGSEGSRERQDQDAVRRDASWDILYCEGVWWERTRKDPAQALDTFDLIAQGNPPDPSLRDRSLFRGACCAEALGDRTGAIARLERLLSDPAGAQRLPRSLRETASRMLETLKDRR